MTRIEIFETLGRRLAAFGRDEASERVIAEACAANEWFRPQEVVRAANAIRDRMLRRDLLEAWLDRYPALPVAAPRRIRVVAAGNIPFAGFFDLLCVLLAGHECLLKPSVKDRATMEYVIGLLRAIAPGLPVEADAEEGFADALIASGSDDAVRHFGARYAGIPSLLRGSRYSVAVLSGNESETRLQALADDIFSYSGLGCRNVSLLFVPRTYELRLEVPSMNPKYRHNYLQRRAMLTLAGREFRDLGGALLTEGDDCSPALSELVVCRYDDPEQVRAWLSRNDERLQCVVTECMDHPRRADFGCAQRPTLTDYPDGRDVMEFLARIW